MKKFSILESAIIGLLIGVVISAYNVFVLSTDGFIGQLLGWVSLKPVLDMIVVPDSKLFLVSFLFFVAVYTLYGIIIGLFIQSGKKTGIAVTMALFVLAAGTIFEQVNGTANMVKIPEPDYFTASVVKSIPKLPKQYFGNEAVGDLNADARDDVAFIIYRDDNERGILYYLSSALATTTGHVGTNLIFIGEKIQPQALSIDQGIIKIDYLDLLADESTTTLQIYAQVIDGKLVQNK